MTRTPPTLTFVLPATPKFKAKSYFTTLAFAWQVLSPMAVRTGQAVVIVPADDTLTPLFHITPTQEDGRPAVALYITPDGEEYLQHWHEGELPTLQAPGVPEPE